MTRIIAIVVVIVAAVVAYMYTSAGDVEIGREVEATSTQPAGGDAAAVTTDLPLDAALEEDEEIVVLDDTPAEELAEEVIEAEAIEGEIGADEAEIAAEADLLDDTAESLPGEVVLDDEEPALGVGTVSTEEETDGAGVAGIVAEEGEQDGLPGTFADGEGDEAIPGTTLESSPTSVTDTGDVILETPEGLDTSNDAAPDAVIPGEADVDAAIAVGPALDLADDGLAEDLGNAEVIGDDDPSIEVEPTEAPGALAVDPGPALRTDLGAASPAADDIDALLDPATVVVTEVIEALNAANIEPAQRIQLIEALETARDSPDLLPGVLDRVRAALAGE